MFPLQTNIFLQYNQRNMLPIFKIIMARNYLLLNLTNAWHSRSWLEIAALPQVYWHSHHRLEKNECGVYLSFLLECARSCWRYYWTSDKLLFFLLSRAPYDCKYFPKERFLSICFCQQNILWWERLFRVL